MKNYSVNVTLVDKVSVTISRLQLWKNYVSSWSEVAWAEYGGTTEFQRVADVLLSGELISINYTQESIRRLFREGYTCLLLADAMEVLDTDREILREIIITDTDENDAGNLTMTVKHEDINF